VDIETLADPNVAWRAANKPLCRGKIFRRGHFQVSSLPGTISGAMPAASATAASSVSTWPAARAVRRQDRGEVESLRGLRAPQLRAVDSLADQPVLARLIVSRRQGRIAADARSSRSRPARSARHLERRAPSWISTRSGCGRRASRTG